MMRQSRHERPLALAGAAPLFRRCLLTAADCAPYVVLVLLLAVLGGCAGREASDATPEAPGTPGTADVLPMATGQDARLDPRSDEHARRERMVGSDDAAAAADAADRLRGRSGGEATIRVGGGHPTVEELLEDGLHLGRASPVHLAIRGTAGAGTVRCAWRGIARTAAQREGAVRFWLQLGADEAIPNVAYLEALFTAMLDVLNPEYRETAKSNFLAIARGGLSEEYLFLTCFADYTVSNYLAGCGADDGDGGVRPDGRGGARTSCTGGSTRRELTATAALQTRGDYEASLQDIGCGGGGIVGGGARRPGPDRVPGADGRAQCHRLRGVAGGGALGRGDGGRHGERGAGGGAGGRLTMMQTTCGGHTIAIQALT